MDKYNIILIENNLIIQEGLRSILNKSSLINSVLFIDYDNSQKNIKDINQEFDILVIDADYIEQIDVNFINQLSLINPDIKLIFLIWNQNKERLYKIFSINPDGIIYRLSDCDELIKAIQITKNGGTYFNSSILEDMFSSSNKILINNMSLLSKRELEIVSLIAKGLTSKQIAEKLYLSKFTVENHRKKIIKKLNVKNTVEVIQLAIKTGILSI